MSVRIQVEGVPMPKGSLTRMPNGAMLPAGTAESRIKHGAWRVDLRAAAKEAMGADDLLTGALMVMIDCTLPYPRSSIRKSQFGWWPAKKKPDVDKLARGVLDHLKGIVWVDDAQVVCLSINKSYAWDDRPGAFILVDELSEERLRSWQQAGAAIRSFLNE